MSATIEAFRQAMSNAGLEHLGEITADGTLHRFTVPGDKPRSGNGWYVLHGDEPAAGAFGCWKQQISETWSGKPYQTMDPTAKAAHAANMEAVKRQREAEQERIQAKCREWCAFAWKKADDATNEHPYLKRKCVNSYGLKVFKDSLLVPVQDLAGAIHGVQFIRPQKDPTTDKDKMFKTGTDKAGHFFKIGMSKDSTVIVCEGYATGATVHQATGHAVAIAFDSGNLLPVAQGIRSKLPEIKIILAADDDHTTKGNPGLTKATEAARIVGGLLAVPVFPGTRGPKDTDFNDLHQSAGLDAVRLQIEAAAPVTSGPSATTEAPGDHWPVPLPLPEGLPPVKVLDPAMIPAPLRGWLMDIADRMQIPPDFSTAAAVVALGSIIGRGCGIHPKRHDDWLVIPNLWGGVIGRPSLMKTPAITEAQKLLVMLETEARTEYQAAAQAQEIEEEITKITRAAICEEIKRAVKKDEADKIEQARARLAAMDNEAPATRRRYQTQDGTTEKIGELLNQNPRGLLINRDELIGWFHTLDKSGREGDRAFYLEAWNGTRGYTYDRIGRGTLDIDALCASIFGAITPGPLSDYVYQASRGGNGDDGLMQRFQVMVWPDVPGEWHNVDRFPDTTEKKRVGEIFKVLAGDIPGAIKENGADIPGLRFSAEGQEVFDTWRGTLESRLRSDHGLPSSMESHLAKYRSLMPSLALIFHLVEVADGTAKPGPVSEQAAIMAAAWCDYLESHAGRIYGGVLMPGMESAREIVKHIRRGAIQDGCKPKDIYRNHWARLATADEVKAGLEVLTEYDWLTVTRSDTTGGRPAEVIRLNPAIKV